MRAGKLDKTIRIDAPSTDAIDDYGVPSEAWSELATVRAEVIQQSTDEFLATYGETETFAVVFRIRWLGGVTPQHRVAYDGRYLNIREVKEIGRRKLLELRCEEVRA